MCRSLQDSRPPLEILESGGADFIYDDEYNMAMSNNNILDATCPTCGGKRVRIKRDYFENVCLPCERQRAAERRRTRYKSDRRYREKIRRYNRENYHKTKAKKGAGQ